MCHLILLMPVLAIPLFWFMPLLVAAPVYSVILIASGWIYYLAIRAMQRPVETGPEELIHSTGEVVGKEGTRLRVHVHSETWSAESMDELQIGDFVEIIAIKNMKLKVRRISEIKAAQLTKE